MESIKEMQENEKKRLGDLDGEYADRMRTRVNEKLKDAIRHGASFITVVPSQLHDPKDVFRQDVWLSAVIGEMVNTGDYRCVWGGGRLGENTKLNIVFTAKQKTAKSQTRNKMLFHIMAVLFFCATLIATIAAFLFIPDIVYFSDPIDGDLLKAFAGIMGMVSVTLSTVDCLRFYCDIYGPIHQIK